jgi:Tfp pilus assembly protein PilF
MATVFYLGAMYCYLSARGNQEGCPLQDKTRTIVLFGLAGILSILGLMTKEVVVTVPLMMLASEWILFPKKNNKIAYVVLAVVVFLLYELFVKMGNSGFSIFRQSVVSESHDGEMLSPVHYLLTQMRVFLTFLRILVWPVHQNLDYDYPASSGILYPPLTLVGLSAISGIIFLIIKLRRSFPVIAFGLAWMLITFSANLAPRANVIFEHKLYLISFGFFLVLVGTLSMAKIPRRTLFGILWCIVALLAGLSFQRNKVWSSDLSLWEDVVSGSPHKARPYNNRGLAYDARGRFEQAIADYNKALEINPKYVNAYDNRGVVWARQGRFDKAVADYSQAIALSPDWAQAYNNRGAALFQQGNFSQAITDYSKAIALNHEYADAYNNRGTVYSRQGNLSQALADYNKAIARNAHSAQEYNNRGNVYTKAGNYSQAMADYRRAIDSDPDFAQTYNNLAIVFYKAKEYAKALDNLRRAKALGYAVNSKFFNAVRDAINGVSTTKASIK